MGRKFQHKRHGTLWNPSDDDSDLIDDEVPRHPAMVAGNPRDAHAAQAVFNVTELTEMIMLASEPRDVVRFRRISKFVRNTIDKSPGMRKKFMKEIDGQIAQLPTMNYSEWEAFMARLKINPFFVPCPNRPRVLFPSARALPAYVKPFRGLDCRLRLLSPSDIVGGHSALRVNLDLRGLEGQTRSILAAMLPTAQTDEEAPQSILHAGYISDPSVPICFSVWWSIDSHEAAPKPTRARTKGWYIEACASYRGSPSNAPPFYVERPFLPDRGIKRMIPVHASVELQAGAKVADLLTILQKIVELVPEDIVCVARARQQNSRLKLSLRPGVSVEPSDPDLGHLYIPGTLQWSVRDMWRGSGAR